MIHTRLVTFLDPLLQANGVAVSASKDVWVCGHTRDEGVVKAFVSRISGDRVVFTTLIGTRAGPQTQAYAISLDEDDGSAYITGRTMDPTILPSGGGTAGYRDAFVARIAADGGLVWVRRIGSGHQGDSSGFGVAVDSATHTAFVVGVAEGPQFPISNETGPRRAGSDAFVMKLDANGEILASLLLAGAAATANSIVLFPDRQALVAVGATSGGFVGATVIGPAHRQEHFDAFAVSVSMDLKLVIWSVIVGGSGRTSGRGVTAAGDALWFVGATDCEDLPTTDQSAVPMTLNETSGQPNKKAFAAYMKADGTFHLLGVFGGAGDVAANDVVALESGAAWVTGPAEAPDFPGPGNPEGRQGRVENYDGFLASLDTSRVPLAQDVTLFGGLYDNIPAGVAAYPGASRVVVVGRTDISDGWEGPTQGNAAGPMWSAFAATYRLDI